ncbi:MAG: DUF4153 domain-containing protein [Gemmatimonadota bacterium]
MSITHSRAGSLTKAGSIAGVALLLGLGWDYLLYGKVPGLGFPLYIMLIAGGLLGLLAYFNKPVDRQTIWLLIPLGFFSLMVFVRSSELLTVLNIMACFLLLMLMARVSPARRVRAFRVGHYLSLPFLPLKFVVPLFHTLSELMGLRSGMKDQGVWSRVIRGTVMALPVLIVFLFLFASADLVFQKLLSDLLRIEIAPETVVRSILVLLASLVFAGGLSYVLGKPDEVTPAERTGSRALGNLEASIVLGSICVLFLVFILVQLTYLFGGESNIAAQGFTYAAYARKGFFELIVVAVVSFALLWGSDKFVAKTDGRNGLRFKILSSALIIEVMLIMGSAFRRLVLYEEAYGFTTLRFYSHAFIVFLGVGFGLLLHKICRDRKESALALGLVLLMVLFLAGMNGLNPEALIARRNIERYASTGKVDGAYLSRLSEDAIPVTVQLLDTADEDLKGSLARELYWRAVRADQPRYARWQALNLSRRRADRILEPRLEELARYKDHPPVRVKSVAPLD